MSSAASEAPDATLVRVLGNLNIDLLLTGVASLPAWGQETIGSSRASYAAGQAGYIASSLGVLQVPTVVAGTVGTDADGARLRDELTAAGVDVSPVREVPGRTGLTVAIVREDGERAFVSDLGVSASVTADVFADCIRSSGAEYTVLAGTSNTPSISCDQTRELLRLASADSLTVFDPGWDPEGYPEDTREERLSLLADVDLYLPNEDEARAATGEKTVEQALAALQQRTRGRVVVKCGAHGSIAENADGTPFHIPALPVRAENAVGAGDVFDAGLVSALLDGRELADAMRLATVGAAHYVSRTTDRFPRRSDIPGLRPVTREVARPS